MDTLFIEHLSLRGKHGVHEDERSRDQEFLIDIKAHIDTRDAAASDDLADTVDWVLFHDIARDTVEGESYRLIERLAEIMAQRILEFKRVASVEITIRKKEILEGGLPGVTIVRSRA
jgi:dihydroneopterin aldolase